VPCANLARRIGRSDWVKLTIRENRTGFYTRVLEPGALSPGDRWELRERPNPDGQIRALNHCFYLQFDPHYAERVTQMEGLVDWWKQQMREKRERGRDHWSTTVKD
jgi:MOSC domain-containing protein YiiM